MRHDDLAAAVDRRLRVVALDEAGLAREHAAVGIGETALRLRRSPPICKRKQMMLFVAVTKARSLCRSVVGISNMHMTTDFMLDFWGKTSTDPSGLRKAHPLVWHALDVAAVVEQLLEIFPEATARLRSGDNADASAARALLIRLALLHDIGKFAIGFQAKAPDFYPGVLGALPGRLPLGDHTAIGLRLLLKCSPHTRG